MLATCGSCPPGDSAFRPAKTRAEHLRGTRIIVQRHEGRIWAETHPSGAVFCFVLPLTRTGDGGLEIEPFLTVDAPVERENE